MSAADRSAPGTEDGRAVIIGAGPAGLTAAHELLARTGVRPVVLERTDAVGGLSRTVRYKGNCLDLGGHRFFSKSDEVMRWWLDVLPLQAVDGQHVRLDYQSRSRTWNGDGAGPDPDAEDRVMLLRNRRSRICYDGKLFDYPLRPSLQMCLDLGLVRMSRIAISYAWSVLRPAREERNLEDFMINRFGRELYLTFFKSYTEKVWGRPCREISADWGRQRIRGLSVGRSITHALKRLRPRDGLAQRATETSLIERFLYPKYGPGQMWEEVAARVRANGGEILTERDVDGIELDGDRVVAVHAVDRRTGERLRHPADHVISTMPVGDLVRALDPAPRAEVTAIAEGLVHRAFIVVGLLLRRLRSAHERNGRLQDNWLYIHDPDVRVGRVQIVNNWSPYCVADPDTTWIAMEYFCDRHDELWRQGTADLVAFAAAEGERLGMFASADVLDGTVAKEPHAYPAYVGTFDRFDELRGHLDAIANLYLVGRNGMHRYNNQDHSMLTAMAAVEAIRSGSGDKEPIWSVNTEQEYHEDSSAGGSRGDEDPHE